MIVCQGKTDGGTLAQLMPDAETAAAWMQSIQAISTKPIVWEVWTTEHTSLRDALNTKPKGTS